MTEDIAVCFYRIALSAAVRHDLNSAVEYCRLAILFDESHKNAIKLLSICLHELGYSDHDDADDIQMIKTLSMQKKWREAVRLTKKSSNRSVRMLNIQGCLYSCARLYGRAVRSFSEALSKDCGDQQAVACLAEATRLRDSFWWRFHERSL